MKVYIVTLHLYSTDYECPNESASIEAVCSSKEKAEEILHKLNEYYENKFIVKPISEWEKGETPIYFYWDWFDITIDEHEMDTFVDEAVKEIIYDQNRQSSSGSDTSD